MSEHRLRIPSSDLQIVAREPGFRLRAGQHCGRAQPLFLVDEAGSRVRDLEARNRGSIQAADEGGFSLFPAETDVGGALEDFPLGVFEDDL